jgi:hypothetical protein
MSSVGRMTTISSSGGQKPISAVMVPPAVVSFYGYDWWHQYSYFWGNCRFPSATSP